MSDLPVLLAEGLLFPEGPAFAPDGTLWWVEIEGGRLGCLNGGRVRLIAIGGRPNGSIFDVQGRLWIADQGLDAIRHFDPGSGAIETVLADLDGEWLGKPNDLAFDTAGNLIFTCPVNSRSTLSGTVLCLCPDGAAARVVDRLYFPNGLAFSPDGADLLLAEAYRHRLLRGRWDPAACRWSEARVWAVTQGPGDGPSGPDGLAFTAEGDLFVAVFGHGHVLHLGADGAEKGRIVVSGARPTNLAFDPSGKLGLVVSEAASGLLWSYPHLRRTPSLFTGGEP